MPATSKVTREHHRSNREKLQAAHDLILEVSRDEFFGPSAFEMLANVAASTIANVMLGPLDPSEKHELRMAAIAEAVPETDEPALCKCGKHYEGAPCSAEFCEHCGELQGPLGYCVYDKADGHARYETEFVHTRFTESETSSLYDRT